MRAGSLFFLLSLIGFIIVVDIYTFRGVRILSTNLENWLKSSIYISFWLIPLVIIALMFYISLNMNSFFVSGKYKVWYFLMGLFILFYVPKLLFMVFQFGNDLVRISGKIIGRYANPDSSIGSSAALMTRAEFLSKIGILIAAIPFISVLHGIIWGRFKYTVNTINLNLRNLPDAFNGYRVLQISDWHIGSFLSYPHKVEEAVAKINDQNADIILFTGDMVNNIAEEMVKFIPFLQRLKAKDGLFSILGNHDYGEYVPWKSEQAKRENLEKLYSYHQEAGFRLLRNDSSVIERGTEAIGIVGVENWGLPPFPQYGNITRAQEKVKHIPFKILMSHDPSHWDAEVLSKTDFKLTLSGHTHGMQFGINILGIKWSPVKWKYPRWSGLYKENDQFLYVNVGIGYIGFPGRVGFHPEITIFNLSSEK